LVEPFSAQWFLMTQSARLLRIMVLPVTRLSETGLLVVILVVTT
jgi:hypothetical protein